MAGDAVEQSQTSAQGLAPPPVTKVSDAVTGISNTWTNQQNGSKSVSGSSDETIRVWDASTGVEIVLESYSRSVPVLDVWNVNTGDFRPSVQMTTEGLSRSTMDKSMISLVNGWLINIHTGRYVGRLPVEHTYYRYEMCGFTFVGWTVDHKLVIIQLHTE